MIAEKPEEKKPAAPAPYPEELLGKRQPDLFTTKRTRSEKVAQQQFSL